MIEGAIRINLDGAPTEAVTAEEAKYSIDRHQAKLQAKQAAVVQPSSQDNKEELISS